MSHEPMAVTVTLTDHGKESINAPGKLDLYPPPRRALRAAVFFLISIGLAALLIPIPIVHLFGIPLMLVLGIVTAVRSLGRVAKLEPMHIPCPKCGARNNIGGGLGFKTETGPVEMNCQVCRRPLALTFGVRS